MEQDLISKQEQELISKKELLEMTGISYGQLYRWKRKNLIPEEWFIRKSTFTGQETFFLRKQILERINKIKHLKDDLSLDELADVFLAPESSSSVSSADLNIALSKEQLIKRNIVTEMTVNLYVQQFGDLPLFSFSKILGAFLLETLLETGEMNLDEGKMLLQTLEDHYPRFAGTPASYDLIFIRKMGISSFIFASSQSELYFDKGVKVVTRLPLAKSIEALSNKLNETGGNV